MRIALLVMLMLLTGPSTARAGVGFDDLPPRAEAPADADMAAATQWVRDRLHGRSPQTPQIADDAPRVVILSISDGHRPAKVVHAGGQGLFAAAEAAVENLSADASPKWVRLDVVTRTAPVTKLRDTFIGAYQRDRDGLVIGQGERRIALPAGQLLGGGFVDDQRLVIDALKLDIPGFAALWDDRPVRLQRFNTVGMIHDGRGMTRLTADYRDQPDPDPDQLLAIARQAGRYLTQAVDDDGRFDYQYDPVTDTVGETYNYVRHAGTTFAMAELYRQWRDPALLAAVERAIGFLQAARHSETDAAGRTVSLILEGDSDVSLGGAGLGLLALSEHMLATGDHTHLPFARQLAEWIMSTQDERGRFTIHAMTWPDRRVRNFRSRYYPGEALLGLLRLYAVTGDDRLLRAATRGIRYQITSVSHVPDDQLEHDHWLLYACGDLTRHVSEPLTHDYSVRLLDAIGAAQHDAKIDPLWAGGWYIPPRSTPAATRAEGLAAAYIVMRHFEDAPNAARARDVIADSIRYQLRTYIGPERAMFFRNPARAHGGFTGSFTQLTVRNDYVQHNLSALLAYRRILLENHP